MQVKVVMHLFTSDPSGKTGNEERKATKTYTENRRADQEHRQTNTIQSNQEMTHRWDAQLNLSDMMRQGDIS